jgi:hypothetical protein
MEYVYLGVMVVRPEAAVFDSLRRRIGRVCSYDGGDTGGSI